MSRITVQLTIALFLLGAVHSATAQDLTKQITRPATAPAITVAIAGERVRFTAPNSVVQMHLQVYENAGQLVFDVSSRGNVLDWTLLDGGGERLVPGPYLCVVTVKSLSGKLSQRIGSALVEEKQVELQQVDATLLTAAQQQAVGPIEENSALTILKTGEAQATTVLANNGQEGQMIRDRGALSFRIGDFFSGNDIEQMRLTEEGNLGIGTNKPQARLDVAGDIRSSGFLHPDKGVEFADGTVQTTGLSGRKDKDGKLIPNASGTGTQNRIAKWTDNSGALGDSLLGEVGGGIELRSAAAGVGINPIFINPSTNTGFSQLQAYPVSGPNTNLSFAVVPRGAGVANNRAQLAIFNTDFIADSTNYEFASLRARGPDFVFGTGKSGTGQNRPFMFAAGFLSDNTTNDGQLFLAANGNVGIGTTGPAAKLDVAGNINTSTQYNIGGSRVLSISGAGGSNVFAGVGAGQANSSGVNNSFFGRNAGSLNTGGFNNSFFGQQAGQSSTGSNNAFFGDRAGFHTSNGSDNSFFGEGAGQENTMGASNSALGDGAGALNTTGSGNIFLGESSGFSNTGENNNTFLGTSSNGTSGITNATAVGYQASVMQSNSIVLGSINGVNFATADTRVGIGTTSPAKLLHLSGVGSDGNGQTDLRVTGTGTTASGITLESTAAGGRTYSLLSTANAAGGGGIGGGKFSVFDVTAVRYRLIIDSTGNVGIGSNSGNDIPNARLSVQGGDAAITTTGNGLILKATDGPNCYRVTVNNVGGLSISPVLCP